MVVSLGDLDCLDAILWLRTGAAAASRLSFSQPKVSRTVQAVSDLFGITLAKSDGEWVVLGDQTLLNLERRVHQEYRWSRGRPLRIEAQYYSGPLYCNPAPEGWIAGNFDYLEIRTPLQYLRTGIIDAWIGCYPDVPEQDDPDLACIHLTRLPTRLVVAADHPLLKKGSAISLDDVRQYPSLALPDNAFPKVQQTLQGLGLWNLPQQITRYTPQKWTGRVKSNLIVGYASAFTIGLFDTPQVVLDVPISLEVGDSLVVRRDYVNHPRLLNLLEHLALRAQQLATQYPDVRIPDA